MGKRSFFDAIILIFAMAISLAASQEAQEASKCDPEHLRGCYDKKEAMKLKGIAIGVILVASMAGVSLPLFSRLVPVFGPEKNLFAVVKAFASGVILATGFMHVLPDSLSNLESDCLPTSPWHEFPFSTFIAMVCAVGTLMMDSFSMAFHRRTQQKTVDVVVQRGVTPPTLPTHIPAHGHEHFLTVLPSSRTTDEASDTTLNRNRVIAQVLEMGIVVHSVVIGLCMGASQSPCAIKPLVAALSFHQFFEGMGLGGCIFQAKYSRKIKSIMVFFFSVTTPFGIVLGIGLSNVYSDNSATALIVIGVLNACSAGLLIYMALVDLLAADFMGPKLQGSVRLQGWAYLAVLLGLGAMSFMSKWA
ncbi:fe(2+) transport protein 1-like isoform X1 [Wolffia australiana]